MHPNETTNAVAETRSTAVGYRTDNAPWTVRLGRWLLLLGTPLLLGALFLIHPDGSGGFDGLLPIGDTWLLLHVVLLPLLGLLGVSFYMLLQGHAEPLATLGRAGVAIYLTFYIAFEAIAGIAPGLLVQGGHTLPTGQQEGIAAAMDALVVPSMVLGIVGSFGAFVAVVSAGVLLRRSGAPLLPVVMLGGAPIATVFHGGTPLDAVGMGLFFVGIAWLELAWRQERNPTTAAP